MNNEQIKSIIKFYDLEGNQKIDAELFVQATLEMMEQSERVPSTYQIIKTWENWQSARAIQNVDRPTST